MRSYKKKHGNLYHLLLLLANNDLQMWINENNNYYLSHDIITDLIVLIGQTLLRQILHNIQQVSQPWYGLIADEATDAANRE